MAEKLSDKLKAAFRKVDTSLGKGVDKASSFKMPTLSSILSKDRGAPKGALYPKASEFKAFKSGQKTKALLSGKKLPSTSKALVTAKTAKNLRRLGTLGRLARATTPIGLGLLAAEAVYKTATPSKEAKARIKATKKRLSKTTTKQMHEDLIKAKGGKMLKGGQKKLDKNKDGKISGEDFKMMKANEGKMMSFKDYVKKQSGAQVSPNEVEELKKKYIKKISGAQVGPAEEKKLMKYMPKASVGLGVLMSDKARKKIKKSLKDRASISPAISPALNYLSRDMGGEAKSTQGYGAARTSGMGLQDEQLPAGKTLDYYKDIM